MRKWFDVHAAEDGSSADIRIFDFIGDWIDDYWELSGVTTAKTFTDALAALAPTVKTIRVHINSPGGDVFGGLTIANALRAEIAKGRTVETIIEGLAASAASVIAMGGSTVRMADNALMFVHAPWSVQVGNAAAMRQMAADLDTIQDTLVKTYQWHTSLSQEEIVALVDGENHQGTWLDADQAIAKGFATEVVTGLKAAASIDPRSAAQLKVPDQYRTRVEALMARPAPAAPAPAPAADVLRLCREGGCLDLAEGLIAAAASVETVQAQIASARETRAAAEARATDIRTLCAAAKLPQLADGYIAGAMPVSDVRTHLTTITALMDSKEIDGSLPPDQGDRQSRARAAVNPIAVYAERNGVPQKG